MSVKDIDFVSVYTTLRLDCRTVLTIRQKTVKHKIKNHYKITNNQTTLALIMNFK
jgi:hypothetical protein